jgi:integrase
MKGEKITLSDINLFLGRYSSSTSINTVRRHLGAIMNEASRLGMSSNPLIDVKTVRSEAKLNKPFDNISEVLEEIKAYNESLYLCCLLTYGCLLRPHREVRELKWGDFSGGLSFINLSGKRNKSGRNRIVPVPAYIRSVLVKQESHLNIFTSNEKAPNPDYFKTIWGRFKRVSKLLEQDQTIYSFRHSGAIDVFKRTGSLTKLQRAMGHSSLAVSLTYLRGLEVSELEESDMPLI